MGAALCAYEVSTGGESRAGQTRNEQRVTGPRSRERELDQRTRCGWVAAQRFCLSCLGAGRARGCKEIPRLRLGMTGWYTWEVNGEVYFNTRYVVIQREAVRPSEESRALAKKRRSNYRAGGHAEPRRHQEIPRAARNDRQKSHWREWAHGNA